MLNHTKSCKSESINNKNEDVNAILPAYGAYVSDDSNVVTDFVKNNNR